MGKIILTLLAIAVCAEATFNVGSLLALLRPPAPPRVAHPAPAPVYPAAPVQPGYASYYRQAPQVVQAVPQARVINQPVVHTSYYRQPVVATPQITSIVIPPAVQTTSTVLSSSFTGQHEPLSHTSFGSKEPLTFASFGSQEPLKFTNFGSQHPLSFTSIESKEPLSFTSFQTKEPQSFTTFGSQEPISFTEFGSKPLDTLSFTEFGSKTPEPAISIVPSQSLSFSFADSSASSGATGSGNSVETVKSEGYSYSLAPEQITAEKTIAPVTTIETFEEAAAPDAHNLDIQELSLRGFEEPLDVTAVAGASATLEVDDKAVEEPTRVVLETEAAADEEPADEEPALAPVVAEVPEVAEVAEVAEVSVQDQKTESRFQAEESPKPQVQQQFQQQPQAIAAVQLNQAEITEQILKQAIPNVINQVSGHIIQQAIPLVVDRAVPQVVYQVSPTVAQQAFKQSERVQIVTPLNTHQQQHQQQNEKVFVMYATSAPNNQQQQFENVFNNNAQYDVSENLVVPIGNRNQQQQQQQQQSQFQITRGIQAGAGTQEQRQNTAYFNQQIVSNFQRENALLRQQKQQQNGGQFQQQNGGGATFEQIQQNYPGLLPRNKRKPDA